MEVKQFDAKEVLLQGSNLIEASAGTGKTYSIAILALRLVMEKNIPIQEILMVTFTKAAVAELETRVRLFIRLAHMACVGQKIDDDKINDLVLQSIAQFQRPEVERRLKTAILFLDETSINTIHGFCQRTLNEYAFETNQIFGSGATSEAELNELLEATVNQFWRTEITCLESEVLRHLEAGFKREDLKIFAKNILGGQVLVVAEPYETDFLEPSKQKQLIAYLSEFEAAIEDVLNEARAYVDTNYDELMDKVLADTYAKKDFPELLDNADELFKEVLKNRGTKYVQKIFGELLDILDQAVGPQNELQYAIDVFTNKLQQFALKQIVNEVKELKDRNSFLTFDDMIQKLYDAVVERNNVTLRDALRIKYKAVFIDEFQDTDKNQYQIFSHLFSEAPSILFFIGDPKQSIYAWRKADINTYFSAKKMVNNVYGMNTNFRSSNAIVAAQNAFFKPTPDFDTFEFRGAADAIEYINVEAPSDNQKGEFVLGMAAEKPMSIIKAKSKNQIANSTAAIVIELLGDNGYGIVAKGVKRPIQPSDIGILVRNNYESKAIKLLLSNSNIPAITIDETKLSDTLEAKELLYVLRAVYDISRSNINKVLMTNLSGLGHDDVLSINEEFVLNQFKSYQESWVENGVYVMLMRFMSDYKVKSRLLEQDQANGERQLSNVLQLLEILHKNETFNQYAPNELINWLQKAVENSASTGDEFEQRIESDEDAVKILTIHKSKGLEYNIVIAPHIDLQPIVKGYPSFRNPVDSTYYFGNPSLLSQEQNEALLLQLNQENRRLIYVAITRAKYKCYVFSNTSSKQSEGSSLSPMIKAIEDVKPEEIEFVDPVVLDSSFRYKSTDVKFPIAYAKATHFELKEVNWRKLSYTYLNPEHPIVPKLSSGFVQDAYGDFIFKKLKKGAFTGNLLHSIFENIAFNDAYHWDKVVKRSLKRLALVNQDLYNEKLLELLKHVTETVLDDGQKPFKLSELSNAQRLNEFEFDFSVKPFQAQAIKQLSTPDLPFHLRNADQLEGMMNGKIDLFFEHAGKYYILDWKSNFLGDRVEDYSQENVWAAMDENNYHLQYHIYTSAACKYLKMRKPDFNYETEFGGVFYLFLRGIRNDGNDGVFFHKPEVGIIDQLSNILT
jgi:exodeoxyribonuclease V beta subunit